MSNTETAKAPKTYKDTAEYKEILARHKALVDSGEIAILEVLPATKLSFGGFGVMGKVKDSHKNLVLDTAILEDRMWIPPMGATFRFDKEEDLRSIYAIYHCPIYRNQCCLAGEIPLKHRHRYIITDAEKESRDYCDKREEDMKYTNKFYQLSEGVIDLLCNIASIPTGANLNVKRANLCRSWEGGGVVKDRVKKMVDSPDIDYYQTAYVALKAGEKTAIDNKGFYKTINGVYKCNDEILGNSIEHVISYLKTHDDMYVALKKGNAPVAVQKPK